MTTIPSQNFTVSYNPKGVGRIVGFACLAGFLVDVIVLLFPLAPGNVEWRIGVLQQLGDRSVVLLLGLALTMYGILDMRGWRRRMALFCLSLGVIFCLSSVLVIRDSLAYQQQVMQAIARQSSDIQSQIQKAQADPKAAPNITAEQLEQASRVLSGRTEAAKQTTKTSVLKNSISSVGNLLVVGLALIGLGRYGARPPKF